jgi:hypothetical protein
VCRIHKHTSGEIEKMKTVAALIIATSLIPLSTIFADETNNTTSSASTDQPDGSLQLDAGAVAAGIGFVWGHGTLNYHNVERPFSISGISVVDVGAASISATGDVYHLANIKDFEGRYVAWSAGLTVGGGGSATYLKNEHGVVIKLVATSEGLRFNLSGNGVTVKLKT